MISGFDNQQKLINPARLGSKEISNVGNKKEEQLGGGAMIDK